MRVYLLQIALGRDVFVFWMLLVAAAQHQHLMYALLLRLAVCRCTAALLRAAVCCIYIRTSSAVAVLLYILISTPAAAAAIRRVVHSAAAVRTATKNGSVCW